MKYKAEIGMILVTILWGANFAIGKIALNDFTPNYYTAMRFTGAFIVLALIYRKRLMKMNKAMFKAGCLIGIAVGIGYILQTVGLSMTTAAKAGFLTGLYVVLVPVFDCIIRKAFPKINEALGVSLATVGLAVLSLNSDLSIGMGDIIVFISAVSFAVSIIMISRFAAQHDPVVLAILQIGVTAVLSLLIALVAEPMPTAQMFTPDIIGIIIFAIFLGTAVNTVVQNVAQSMISPTTAALILVLEPVFAGVFAYFLVGEILGFKELAGSGLIIVGMLVTLLYKGGSRTH